MGKVASEAVSIAMAPQLVLGTAPTAGWRRLQIEKGSPQNWKRQNETVEDTIFSKNMTPEKGDVVGWKVAPQITHKVNKDLLDLHAEPIFRCVAVHPGGKGQRTYFPTVVVDGGVGDDSFTVPALGDLPAGTLIHVKGSSKPGNNGVFKTVAGSLAGSIKVGTGLLTAEAATPANMTIDVIGFEGTAGNIQMDANGNLTSTGGLNFTTFGIPVGSRIVIGTGLLGTAATSFSDRTNNALVYVKSVAAALIETERGCFDVNTAWVPVVNAGAAKTIQIILGSFYRNYALDDANYAEKILYGEKEDPRAGSDNTTRYTECKGLAVDKAVISAPLKNKVMATLSYIGTDATKPLALASRLPDGAGRGTGPGTAYAPLASAFADTANDLKMIRMTKANGLIVGEINSWTLTLSNGATPKEVQGTPGAIDHHWGEFGHTLSVEAYYNNSAALDAATDNDDLQWDAYLRNHQFAFNFDLPRVAMRNDTLEYTANKQVMLKFDTPAFRNEDTNICGALTLYGFVPDRS